MDSLRGSVFQVRREGGLEHPQESLKEETDFVEEGGEEGHRDVKG